MPSGYTLILSPTHPKVKSKSVLFRFYMGFEPRWPNLEKSPTRDTDPTNALYLSMASLWEAAIKSSLGKLQVPGGTVDSLLSYAEDTGTDILPISIEHIRVLQTLPRLHRDPFDRLLVAQARVEELRLATADPLMHQYEPDALR